MTTPRRHPPHAPLRALAVLVLASAAACIPLGRSAPRALTPMLRNALSVDTVRGTAELPLTAGMAGGQPAWFLVTESSDSADAASRGVNWAPRLASLRGTGAVQRGRLDAGRLIVTAGVDFSPTQSVVADADSAFPPTRAEPGSVARAGYSPLVELPGGIVLNAPVVADAESHLDRLVRLDRAAARATVRISRGYADGRTAWYISTEASMAMVAALEGATFVPGFASVGGAGNAAPADDARSGIVVIVNGPLATEDAAQRHGLRSALRGEGDPNSILEMHPASPRYTPLWDLHMAMWTPRAEREASRERLLSFGEVTQRVQAGLLAGMPGEPGHAGLGRAGVVINCAVVAVF